MSADRGVAELFVATVQQQPDRIALATSTSTVTYGNLLGESLGMAERLRKAGVRRADRVMVSMERGHGYVVVLLALLMIGASVVPVDDGEPRARVARLRAIVKPQLTVGRGRPEPEETDYFQVGDDADLPRLSCDGPVEVGDDTGLESIVFSTSGSTGTPKAVSATLPLSIARHPRP